MYFLLPHWEAAHHPGAAADLPVEPLNHVVCADASPVFAGKVAVSQRFLNTVLNVDIRFLVQLADGSRRHFALTPAIPLYDGRFKRDSLQPGYMERYISRGGGKVPVVVTAAVSLASLIPFVPRCLGQFLRFLLQ